MGYVFWEEGTRFGRKPPIVGNAKFFLPGAGRPARVPRPQSRLQADGPRPRVVALISACLATLLLSAASVGRAVEQAGQAVAAGAPQPLRYVSLSGSDASDGSARAPWRTLQHAVRAAPERAVVTVGPGRYSGFTLAGRRRLTIQGMDRRPRPIVAGDPLQEGDTVRIFDAEEVRLARLAITGATGAFNAGVAVRRSRAVRLDRLLLKRNESFGVNIADSTDVTASRSVMTRNHTGIQISRSQHVLIKRNDLVHNDRMVVDDPVPNNDRGANAVVVYRTGGPVRIVGNRAWGNRARSTDYGFDGGAFELYDASQVSITGNRVWNNENVVETGTSPGGACRGNLFERNVAYRGRATGPTMGMILRCAEGMRIVDNTFYDLDRFVFDVTAAARQFGGSVEGLAILGNRAVSHRDKIYSIDSPLPSSVSIDGQLSANVGGGPLAYVFEKGQTTSMDRFRAWTGFEATGRQVAPSFRDPARGDFRPTPGSVWTAGAR